ncbi:hypothetical protein So717_42910 [Roseobacter cerasinus]|uniref:Uncharacterized protein n=1 Tax=Roseobacter cerasinus TaxID=2602289 RepID=A0A640VVU3_9RHOB|nr:hypothetical protein [Roseobacter cerasinus]GFE52538.1 hypothetical protein So717_42910 [Roseobacter cerasinus]
MAQTTKIATCCYCGTRAALTLGRNRHELACSRCGAPLHEMKRLPEHHPGKVELVRPSAIRQSAADQHRVKYKKTKKRHKPQKKRKGLMRQLFEEAFDVIEDIFD